MQEMGSFTPGTHLRQNRRVAIAAFVTSLTHAEVNEND
jgi:hypothetical protein